MVRNAYYAQCRPPREMPHFPEIGSPEFCAKCGARLDTCGLNTTPPPEQRAEFLAREASSPVLLQPETR